MISFFGLNKFLSKENLWSTEKERLAVIRRVEMARNCDVVEQIFSIISPLGFNSYAKYDLSKKIVNENPIPQVTSELLYDMSEEDMKSYIEELYKVLSKQFNCCIAYLYNINENDLEFLEVKQIFEKKFLKVTKVEIIISCFSIMGIIIMALGLFSLALNLSSLKVIECLIFPIVIVVVGLLLISSFFIKRCFKVIKDYHISFL